MPMRRDQNFADRCPRSVLRTRSSAALESLLKRAVELALASSLMAAGCGPVSGPVCAGDKWKALDGLEPAEAIDYATLRIACDYNRGGPASERASMGTACATASGASCQSELETLLTLDTLSPGELSGTVGRCQQFVVTTAGDRVTRYVTRKELLEFLGSINTPQEVLLLLAYDGYTITCGDASSTTPPELDAPEVAPSGDGFEATVGSVVDECPVTYAQVELRVSPDGTVKELSREALPPSNACAGRRPEGWLGIGARTASSAIADHFTRMAELEAASVIAFEVLARELEHHDAPQALIVRARAARSDEVRHAERTRALAARFGARVCEPEVAARPLRGLEALALDNAIEGCVRETYGAAVGCYQARTASDPEIAALMAELSRDELQHALLALDIDAWLQARLCDAARERVAAARETAVAQLSLELGAEPDGPLQTLAGLPSACAAQRIHAALQAELWS